MNFCACLRFDHTVQIWIAVGVSVIFFVPAPVFIRPLMRHVARGGEREGSGVTSCAQREFLELTASQSVRIIFINIWLWLLTGLLPFQMNVEVVFNEVLDLLPCRQWNTPWSRSRLRPP